MSIETATAFKLLADQDVALRADALAAYQAGGLTAVAELASARGYEFTAAEAEAALAPAAGELSDTELEAVAGGKGRPSRFGSVVPNITGSVGRLIGQDGAGFRRG